MAPLAHADLIGGQFYGLYVTNHATNELLGEISFLSTNNLNMRVTNDPYGDRQHINTQHHDSAPGNGQQIYVRVDFYNNGFYCLPSRTVSVSAGPSGQRSVTTSGTAGCTTGWHYVGQVNSAATSASEWQFWGYWQAFNPTAEAGKGVVQICEDEPWFLQDECSGVRILGADF